MKYKSTTICEMIEELLIAAMDKAGGRKVTLANELNLHENTVYRWFWPNRLPTKENIWALEDYVGGGG